MKLLFEQVKKRCPETIIFAHPSGAGIEAMSKSVPAWICEMYDATAYMELVWSNAQSELTALERGLHPGMDVKAYAASACRDRVKVQREVMAAKVSEAVFRPVPVQYQ
jgi:hypothetical protein